MNYEYDDYMEGGGIYETFMKCHPLKVYLVMAGLICLIYTIYKTYKDGFSGVIISQWISTIICTLICWFIFSWLCSSGMNTVSWVFVVLLGLCALSGVAGVVSSNT